MKQVEPDKYPQYVDDVSQKRTLVPTEVLKYLLKYDEATVRQFIKSANFLIRLRSLDPLSYYNNYTMTDAEYEDEIRRLGVKMSKYLVHPVAIRTAESVPSYIVDKNLEIRNILENVKAYRKIRCERYDELEKNRYNVEKILWYTDVVLTDNTEVVLTDNTLIELYDKIPERKIKINDTAPREATSSRRGQTSNTVDSYLFGNVLASFAG